MAQRNDYTAIASQTEFDFTFKIFATDEVKVYQNGTLLTETTHYTVSLDSAAPSTGTITLVTGATVNDAIALVQAISATRLITYITDGDWKAATVNNDFDRIYVLLNTIMGTSADPDTQISDRLLRFSQSEDRSGKTNAIPSPQEGRYLTWNSGELSNSTAPSVTVTEDFALVSNVAALTALVSGETMAYTLGKTSEGDGGHGFFYYSSANAETPDGQDVIAHATTGNWIRLNFGYNSIYTAVAGGTADAITVTTAPIAGVTNDSTRLFIVENSAGASTVTNPTITINSESALTLKAATSVALAVGATGPAGYKMLVAVNNAASAAILLNPYVIGTANLAADSVDKTKIAADVAGSGLGQNADGSLEVNVDDSTIEISTDTLQVKDAGITYAKLYRGEKVLTSGAITAAASLEFILSSLDSTQSAYNRYRIHLINFLPASDDVELRYTLTADGGSTYASSAYYGGVNGEDSGGSAIAYPWNSTAFGVIAGDTLLNKSIKNSGASAFAEITLSGMNTGSSVSPRIQSDAGYISTGGYYFPENGGGTNTTAADYDGIKIYFESGNFQASGYYVVTKMSNPE